jgi:hypothetical protein
MRSATTWTCTAIILIIFYASNLFATETNIPKFKITGRYENQLAILVPKNTSSAQLEQLIYEIKKAREGNYLNKYFPPTTPKGKMGIYAIIGVYVFADESKATTKMLKKYLMGSDSTGADKFTQQYAEKILAHYYYHIGGNQEFGCLGIRAPGIKSAKYRKLFGNDVPY